jgi:fumarate hydratase class II
VTALSPVIGYDKASAIAHAALDQGTTLKEAALKSGWIDEKAFDAAVDPRKMARPDGGQGGASGRRVAGP